LEYGFIKLSTCPKPSQIQIGSSSGLDLGMQKARQKGNQAGFRPQSQPGI
jgi:hypothetical protein